MSQEVAKEILRQLGGNKFLVMTGAKNLVSSANSLMFSIGRNKSKANKIRITLTASDDYTVEFMQFRPKTLDVVTHETRHGIYCDNLAQVFTNYTGLETKLF